MGLTSLSAPVADYWAVRNRVLGAFWDIDFIVFDRLLSHQSLQSVHGDLLEIGALYGKSSIVLGLHARPNETVYICDIFEDTTSDVANDLENSDSYRGLTRRRFEETYSRYVDRMPRVIQALSDTVTDHVAANSLRFAHIDGGHLFDTVATDIQNAQTLLTDSGVVVLDDFRALHTPGVAAATWAAVASSGLVPIAVTEQKFYGTWSRSTADLLQSGLTAWAGTCGADLHFGTQSILGHKVLIMANPTIWTGRRRLASLLPPIVADKLSGRTAPHLGR